jgi:hypothetical protein
MTLTAFLPIAAGCSTTKTYAVGTDPFASGAVQMLLAGETLEIAGYTRTSDGHRKFRGHVRLITQDTLEFIPGNPASNSDDDATFTLPCNDVASVDVLIPDAGKTRLAATMTVLAVGAAVTGVAIAAAIDSGNMDPRF